MMEKDVLITIGGLLYTGDQRDNVDVIAPGQYYYRRGRHYLIYEDQDEENQSASRNLVWISPGEMVVRKSGAVTTEMVFHPNEDTVTTYSTPFGAMTLGIHTDSLRIRETDHQLEVDLSYQLEIDYRHVSENRLHFLVQEKNGSFSLTGKREN